MNIILLILKIIGIILLVLLGVIITLLLLILFVPFYYRMEGSYYANKPYVMARVRYLFPLLQVYVRYKDSVNAVPPNDPEDEKHKTGFMDCMEGKIKVFGITVYDFFGEKTEHNIKNDEKSFKMDETEKVSEPAAPDLSESTLETTNQQKTELSEVRKRLDGILSDESIAVIEERLAKEEKKSFAEKIRYFISVIKEKVQTMIQRLNDFYQKGRNLKTKAEDIKAKLDYYLNIWEQDYTQQAFQKAKKSLLKLWKSIRPRKGLFKLHFGTGDPGSTGQICGIFGMLYPFVGKYVMIEPDFESIIYEGDFYFKGHITVFSFLKVAWIALFDKDIKRLRKILMNSDKEDKHEQ